MKSPRPTLPIRLSGEHDQHRRDCVEGRAKAWPAGLASNQRVVASGRPRSPSPPPGRRALADGPVQRRRLPRSARRRARGAACGRTRGTAPARSPLTARAVELDQPSVRGLVERVEREPAPRVPIARAWLPRAARSSARRSRTGTELARERARLELLPVVERSAVAKAEPCEEGASLQRRGLLEVGEIVCRRRACGTRRRRGHVVPLERDGVACDGEPAAVERRAERRSVRRSAARARSGA